MCACASLPPPPPNGLTFQTPSSQSPRIRNPVPSWVWRASEHDSGADCQIPVAPAATRNRPAGVGRQSHNSVTFGSPVRSSLWRVSGGSARFSARGPALLNTWAMHAWHCRHPPRQHQAVLRDHWVCGVPNSTAWSLHGPPTAGEKTRPGPTVEEPAPRGGRGAGLCVTVECACARVCKRWPGLTSASAVSPEWHT